MGFILTFLIVIVFVVLPLIVFLIAAIGLLHGVMRPTRGKKKVSPPLAGLTSGPAPETKPPADKVAPLISGKSGRG